MQIARKVQFVENAKIALVDQVAAVFRAIQAGGERDIAESLGQIVVMAYTLGLRLDVPLPAIDRAAEAGLSPSALGETDEVTAVLRHMKTKR